MAKKAPAGSTGKPPANSDVVETSSKKRARSHRTGQLTYTGAIGEIRGMFQEQASLWKAQAEALENALHGSVVRLSSQEPWSSLLDERKRPSLVFEQNDDNSEAIRSVRKKLKRAKQWEYKRPEEEESNQQSEEDSDDEDDDEDD